MDTDLLFVLGIALVVLSLPAIVSALIDGRAPRTPALLILIAGSMIGYAILQRPMAYSFELIPDVIARVVARYTG
ncbi:MAG: hypothetical protein R6V30_14045 [Paracoccaceae bacterium]|nr:hypothetical protein [Loktanella sp.]